MVRLGLSGIHPAKVQVGWLGLYLLGGAPQNYGYDCRSRVLARLAMSTPVAASRELSDLRSQMGATAALWANDVRVEQDRWVALTGARSVSYNLILCHGAPEGTLLADSVEELAGSRLRGLMMVAGPALGDVQQLVVKGWVCVGAMPFMLRELEASAARPIDASVRRLHGADVEQARELIADVFDLYDEIGLIALPPDAADRPGQSVWGAFDNGRLVSCVVAVVEGELVAIWSLATARDARRRGHAARLMGAVHQHAAAGGARASILYNPIAAEPFYRSLDYRVLERWQLWSNPRWVLGRA
jgi:ribosomal protein S18 acetylase RimI-like enzyme